MQMMMSVKVELLQSDTKTPRDFMRQVPLAFCLSVKTQASMTELCCER